MTLDSFRHSVTQEEYVELLAAAAMDIADQRSFQNRLIATIERGLYILYRSQPLKHFVSPDLFHVKSKEEQLPRRRKRNVSINELKARFLLAAKMNAQ